MDSTHHDFGPAASWANLRVRAELLRRLREFFFERGFLEVETPLLSADVVVDRHLDPLSVTLFNDPRTPSTGRQMWLQTSPEFGMKRMLAAGGPPAIYQITRALRGGEAGRLHNPEFTMVEWYRTGDTMQLAIDLLSEVADVLFGCGPSERITFAEAFVRYAGIDPHRATIDELAAAASSRELAVPNSMRRDDRDGWIDLLLVELVEPHLGLARPVIVYDYPASQAALAVVRDDDPPVAERFELYFRSIELANGYHELRDPAVLRDRIAEANRCRIADGKPALPSESRLLDAMEAGLPPCAGVALGFDRVVMLACGATSLAEAIAFPIDRA